MSTRRELFLPQEKTWVLLDDVTWVLLVVFVSQLFFFRATHMLRSTSPLRVRCLRPVMTSGRWSCSRNLPLSSCWLSATSGGGSVLLSAVLSTRLKYFTFYSSFTAFLWKLEMKQWNSPSVVSAETIDHLISSWSIFRWWFKPFFMWRFTVFIWIMCLFGLLAGPKQTNKHNTNKHWIHGETEWAFSLTCACVLCSRWSVITTGPSQMNL